MAKSAALNPASTPFTPLFAAMRPPDADAVSISSARQTPRTDADRSSHLSHFSDYRSVRSSPSPPQPDSGSDRSGGGRSIPTSVGPASSSSPTFRQVDAGRHYPHIESRVAREASMLGSFEMVEGQDTPIPSVNNSFYQMQHQTVRGREATPPVAIRSDSTHGPFGAGGAMTSSSPASSFDSSTQYTQAFSDYSTTSFNDQLRGSSVFSEMVERVSRCENATREIQHDLAEVHRKVNLLVNHALGNVVPTGPPEFKDPFTPGNPPAFNGPRPSISGPSDDISSISQRLNTLTTSVSQLVALQTQTMQTGQPGLVGPRALGSITPQEVPPHQVISPTLGGPPNMMPQGFPPTRPDMRPSPRVPNPPMRTWSAGALELPMRPEINRPDSLLRDNKRRSVSGLLRRDSSGILDAPGDLSGNGRDGPVITKWEQLALAQEVLRSVNKFGVGPPNKIQQRALPFLLRGSDIIAQAPPTQERIAAYAIPAIQIAFTSMNPHATPRGPLVIMISTTVDQATQAQRMIRDLGGPIGVTSALAAGVVSAGTDISSELRNLQQNIPHVLCGTPQKLHALLTAPGGLPGSEVRFLVLDEVDQLIARNLHEFVYGICKLLPPPRNRPPGNATPTGPGLGQGSFNMDLNGSSPSLISQGRRPSAISLSVSVSEGTSSSTIERQTALFSNTVPQDVLNLATAIQLREPVRVLVRRDGNATSADNSSGSRGLRQFYLYLAFTAGGGRADALPAPGGGLGIIGSGRGAGVSAESAQAREWKLDALADLFDDVEVTQAIVHVGGMTALDAVVYKLASHGLEAIPLHGDMSQAAKLSALNKFRSASSVIMRQPITKALVVYDVQVKAAEVPHLPLIINYDLPKAVEEYAHRVAPAISSGYARAGVVVNFVTATGGDVEMLRSIECFYKIKCPEVPMSLRDVV